MKKIKEGTKVRAFQPKSKHLTHNKDYFVEWISMGGYLAVRNDAGKIKPYAPANFRMISDFLELNTESKLK